MDRGTYAAASAGMAQLIKLEVVSNNLANVNTPGFKRQALIGEEQTFEQTLASVVAGNDPFAQGDHDRVPGVTSLATVTDFTQGPTAKTNNPLDVALRNPNDFFVVTTPDGTQYTRAGSFTLNDNGQIVTPDGMPVVGSGGPLTVTSGGDIRISASGSVSVGGQEIGSFQVARFADPTQLHREANARFSVPDGANPPTTVPAQVEPEALEMANVSTIHSMVDLITVSRAFEQYTKSSKTIDELSSKMIQQIGTR